jgi:hypothetical protein
MNKTRYIRLFGLFFAIALAISLLVGANSLAQQGIPATEPGGEPAKDMPPSYDSSDPAFEAVGKQPPDENAPAEAKAPSVTFSYYQVTGATLRGRNSTTGYAYDNQGCSHVTAGVLNGMILNTELPLPDGSIIKYLRVYYFDQNAANGVEGYITRYTPGSATTDLVHAGSSDAFVGGDGFVVSAEITETVNNTPYAYTVIGWPDALGAANQICGLRVAYYAPFSAQLYLPVVRH